MGRARLGRLRRIARRVSKGLPPRVARDLAAGLFILARAPEPTRDLRDRVMARIAIERERGDLLQRGRP